MINMSSQFNVNYGTYNGAYILSTMYSDHFVCSVFVMSVCGEWLDKAHVEIHKPYISIFELDWSVMCGVRWAGFGWLFSNVIFFQAAWLQEL